MRSWKTPTPEEVDKAVSLLGRAVQINYFFDKLENPLWIEPLREKGFLEHPPAVVVDSGKDTITFPVWPVSRFLARVAKEAPDIVMDQILRIPHTTNPRVQTDLLDAALSTPSSIAVRLAPRVKKWASGEYVWFLLLAISMARFVAHLARGGYHTDALAIAKVLLVVLPPQQQGARRRTGQRSSAR